MSNNPREVLLKIGRKFSPKYHLIINWELILICIVFILYSIVLQRVSFVIVSILLDLFLIGVSLFLGKRIANGTRCYFYDNKVVYKFDFLFIHRKVEYNYSDIQDIVYGYDIFSGYSFFHKLSYRRFWQKKFGYGDIWVSAKKTGIFQKNFVVKDVANVEETFEKITKAIGDKLDS